MKVKLGIYNEYNAYLGTPKDSLIVCLDGLRQYVYLPRTKRIESVTIVFTKRGYTDSFKLRKPGGIEGVSAYLMCAFVSMLRRARRQGFTHFHFEHVEK